MKYEHFFSNKNKKIVATMFYREMMNCLFFFFCLHTLDPEQNHMAVDSLFFLTFWTNVEMAHSRLRVKQEVPAGSCSQEKVHTIFWTSPLVKKYLTFTLYLT